jgi:hypothetical protein
MLRALSQANLAFLFIFGFLRSVLAETEWQVPEATLRYKVTLSKRPSHPTAGYYAQLPDGGILRGQTPSTTVMTETGKLVPSFLLWQNPESGFSLVFAEPGDSSRWVYVYVRNDRPAQFWQPNSGLTPSGLLAAQPARDTIEAARALAKMGRVETSMHVEEKAGVDRAPLSIGGDDTGRPRPGAFYLLAYVEASVEGNYWVAPFTLDGASEVWIDGVKLVPKERSKKWGGQGAAFNLTRGLHRVEILQTAPGTGPYHVIKREKGLMYLTWAPPKEEFKSVETRVLRQSEIARSGRCSFHSVEAKDGSPVACALAEPGLVYWFENEEPLILYRFEAISDGQPPDTTFTWTFPDRSTVQNKFAPRLLPAFQEYRAQLTAQSSKGTSQCIVPFFTFGTRQTSLDIPSHRSAFRSVLAGMLESYPRTPDPVAGWSDAYWNNLLRTVEDGEGYALLSGLFSDRWDAVQKKLTPPQLSTLQDVLLNAAERDNPPEALQWVAKFIALTTDPLRRNELKLRQAELQAFYLADTKSAEQTLTALAATTGDFADHARIRLGDLAFREGDLNKATAYYAEVQNRARARRNTVPAVPANPLAATMPQGLARKKDFLRERKGALPSTGTLVSTEGPAPGKAGALQEVSLSENVQTLVEEGFLLEARQALQLWETEFPLSKVSGDYILRESSYYMKLGNWKRARPMLEAYCREIDASSFLPETVKMLMACVKQSKEPPATIRELILKVKERLRFHPVARELDAFLAEK